jgi:hypothetical protein
LVAGSETSLGETSTGGVQLARAFARKSSKLPGGTAPAAAGMPSSKHDPSVEPTEDGEAAVAGEATRLGISGPSGMAGKPHIRLVKTPTPPRLLNADLRCYVKHKNADTASEQSEGRLVQMVCVTYEVDECHRPAHQSRAPKVDCQGKLRV